MCVKAIQQFGVAGQTNHSILIAKRDLTYAIRVTLLRQQSSTQYGNKN